MRITPEALHSELARLVADIPDLAHGPITFEMVRWLGEVATLVELINSYDAITLKVTSQNLSGVLRETNAQTIVAIVYRALAKAARNAPREYQGASIPAGHIVEGYKALSIALGEAKSDVLIVDAYADHEIMDYTALVPETVPMRVLADAADWKQKPSLKPAVDRWAKQWGAKRPLTVRLSPVNALHNRYIVVDGKTAWELGQSANQFAKHQHTSVIRVPREVAEPLIAVHEELWAAAQVLVFR